MDSKNLLKWIVKLRPFGTGHNWLTATHIPGIFNIEAELESIKQELSTEWMLNKTYTKADVQKLDFKPKIGLFAS